MSRVMIIVDKEELYNIDGDDEITDQVLRAILRTYTGLFADYVYIDEALISYRFHIKQEDIYQSLLRLNRKHILHYIPRRRTPYITYYSRRELPQYIQIPISVYEDRKRIVENRVNAMLNYTFAEKGCRENIILEYFGESPDMPNRHSSLCFAGCFFSRSIAALCPSLLYTRGMKIPARIYFSSAVASLLLPAAKCWSRAISRIPASAPRFSFSQDESSKSRSSELREQPMINSAVSSPRRNTALMRQAGTMQAPTRFPHSRDASAAISASL